VPVTGGRSSSWFVDELETPLARLQTMASADRDTTDLIERTRAALEPLRDADLPSVLEHGDMSPPNLFLADGRLQAVDWERGSLEGLPGHDLVMLIMFIARARSRTDGRLDVPYDAALVRPDAWGRALLERHLRAQGVAVDLAPQLIAATWLRGVTSRLTAATSGYRTDEADDPRERDALWQSLKGDRDFALWPLAVDRLVSSA
jgi:aminoglycoside phosphotransferase (APT) family kinase protein